MLKKIIAPLASLKLTVVLLSLSMFLILVGTVAQKDVGVWHVQREYFHSHFVTVDMGVFLPRDRSVVAENARFLLPLYDALGWLKVPMLGGYSLGVLLLANLLAAHATRFKFIWKDLILVPLIGLMFVLLWQWHQHPSALLMWGACGVGAVTLGALAAFHGKRTGVILTHLGLVLLIIGEGVSSASKLEMQMTIDEGSSAVWAQDTHDAELVVVEAGSGDAERVTAVSHRVLRDGKTINDPRLPFEIKVEDYQPNSVVYGPRQQLPQGQGPRATAGQHAHLTLVERRVFAGAGSEASKTDLPAAYLTLSKDGKALDVTLWYNQDDLWAATASAVQADLKQIGVNCSVQAQLWQPYIEKIRKNEAAFFRFGSRSSSSVRSSSVRS